ncbi:MAG: WD40 repeat domain-containing protein [Planctomycetia bacterium]|nr:WD40 repeat domain-containing protein [Planctomycetia bacterium]
MTKLVRLVRVTLAALFAVVVVGLATAQDQPAPPPKDLKEAVETLRDTFDEDYKAAENDVEKRKALAQKLFDRAAKLKTPALQYACYDEARKLAASAGDAKLAIDALSALTSKFRGTPPDLANETLKLLGDAELTPGDVAGLLTLASDAANAALEREDYAGAISMGKLWVAAAKKTGDPEIVGEARKFLGRAEGLKSAVDTIKIKPTDPTANESLGQYWTFTKGRWDVGLKYLAKGSNKELAAAATKDLANPKTAKDRTAVADMWYKLAKDFRGAEHKRLIERSWEWYSAALTVAQGDEGLKSEERIKQIEKSYPELFDQTLTGHTGAAAGVIVTPDGKTLISVGNDNTVRLWDAVTGKLQKTLEGHTSWIGSVITTPDGTLAITGGGDNTIRVWDIKGQKEVKKLEGHTVAIRGLSLTADGKTLVSGASDKTCRTWDLAKGKELKRYGEEKESVESVAITPDGKYVLAGNDVGVITVYDAKSGDVKKTYKHDDGSMIYTLTTTPDGKWALSGARDKDIHVWNIADGKSIKRLKGHTEQIYQIALSHDGKYVVSASYDKTVRVWNLATGKEIKKFDGHTDGIQGACFTPDGRFVFSASWDKTVRKWRLPVLPGATKTKD